MEADLVTNPVERVDKELKRRSNDDDAVVRLLGAVLFEVDDEWQVANAATSAKNP